MRAFLITLLILVCAGVLFLSPASGSGAVLLLLLSGLFAFSLIRRIDPVDREFLLNIFLAGLLVRVLVGVSIYLFNLQEFFGGDANSYDYAGYLLARKWGGESAYIENVHLLRGDSGWGMPYFVGLIYFLIGRNPLAVQFINSVIGAATAVVIYLCADRIFQNKKVAAIAAVFVAFFPSLVLWSSQGLKDGPIVFLLAVGIYSTLRLGEKFSLKYVSVVSLSLLGVLSLRFYIFYMLLAAITGALVIGPRIQTLASALRQVGVLVVLGLVLTYFGVLRTASTQIDTYADLDRIQLSRADLARSAESGFGRDVDVSTTGGALTTIPMGVAYLLFAPFPWEVANLRQSITIPEMIVWWASFPVMILGLWYSVRFRFRQSLPILLLTFMVTLAYSVFAGNVGTAYRQRAQLLVFYFIFVAVGIVLFKEKRDTRLLVRQRRLEPPVQNDPAEVKAKNVTYIGG